MIIYGVKREKYRNKLNKLHGISLGDMGGGRSITKRPETWDTLRAETSRGLRGPRRPQGHRITPRSQNFRTLWNIRKLHDPQGFVCADYVNSYVRYVKYARHVK